MSPFIARQDNSLLARRRPASALLRPKINLRLLMCALRLTEGAVMLAAGIAAFRELPSLHAGAGPATAAFVAGFVLALQFLLAERGQSWSDAFLRRSPSSRVLSGVWRTSLPFAASLAISFALFESGSGGLRGPLVAWQETWGLATVAGVAALRGGCSFAIAYWRAQGRLKQIVAIVGTGELAERLIDWVQAWCAETIEVIGVFDDRVNPRTTSPRQRSLLRGTVADLIEMSKQVEVDRVVLALPHAAEQRLMMILGHLKQMPVDISLAPDMIGFAAISRRRGEFAGLPLISVYGRPLEFAQSVMKGAFDRLVAALALAVTWPIFVAAAIAIRLDSPGPILFCQNRYGFGNKVIRVFKFRTMRTELADYSGARQVEPDDPRITRVGLFLRRTSIDELPQLLNVLRGEMSLIGPRPMPMQMRVEDKLNHEIVSEYARRHHLKPGVTGWAQVNGHLGRVATAESLRARVAHDLYYIDNWSLWLDIQILFLTLKVVLRGEGAF